MLLEWERPQTEYTILRLKSYVGSWREEVSAKSWNANSQVDVHTLFNFSSGSLHNAYSIGTVLWRFGLHVNFTSVVHCQMVNALAHVFGLNDAIDVDLRQVNAVRV